MPKPPNPPKSSIRQVEAGGFRYHLIGLLTLPFFLMASAIKYASIWAYRAPKFIKVILAVLFVGFLGGSAYVIKYFASRRADASVAYLWKEYATAAHSTDVPEMIDALQKIIALKPDEHGARERLQALTTGSADPSDGPTCWLLTRVHIRNNDWTSAAREARKRLESEPMDWLSHCVLAKEALARNDRSAADAHFEKIANVQSNPSHPDLGLILFAIELRERAGKDCTELRSFILSKVLPSLRSVTNLSQIAAAGKIQIVYSFASAVVNATDAALPGTMQYWAFASQLAEETIRQATEEKSLTVLGQSAVVHQLMGQCIGRYRQSGLINATDAQAMLTELDRRTERIWAGFKLADPRHPDGYAGTASYHLKANRLAEAEAEAVEGIQNAGPYPQLLNIITQVCAKRGVPERALDLAQKVARKNPDHPGCWQSLVDAALASNRRDVAIDACKEARRANPNLPWPNLVEGQLLLEHGDGNKALEMLNKLPESIRKTNPYAARIYSRALVSSGNEVLAPDFVKAVIFDAESKDQPALAAAVIQGLNDAPFAVSRADLVINQCNRIVARWPGLNEQTTEIHWIRAIHLAKAAEFDTPRWDAGRVATSLRAFDQLRIRFPGDIRGPIYQATLRLRGLKQPEFAFDALKPILGSEAEWTKEAREIIGTVLVANKDYSEAVKVLGPLVASVSPSPTALTQYALALHGKSDSRAAKQTLRSASFLPMNDREREEYVSAALIIRESP